jgi:hypothetical protein
MAQSGALLQRKQYLECIKLVKEKELCRGNGDLVEIEAYVYGRALSEWFEVYTACTPTNFTPIVDKFFQN